MGVCLMGGTLTDVMGGSRHSDNIVSDVILSKASPESLGRSPQRAQEQILNPMSGAPPMMGAQNMDFSNPQQQPQNFGSSPTNALSNLGRRF